MAHATRVAMPANQQIDGWADVVIDSTGDTHLLGRLPLPDGSFIHHPSDCPAPQ